MAVKRLPGSSSLSLQVYHFQIEISITRTNPIILRPTGRRKGLAPAVRHVAQLLGCRVGAGRRQHSHPTSRRFRANVGAMRRWGDGRRGPRQGHRRRPVGRRGPLRTMRAARHCEAEPVAGRAAACAEDWSRGHGWCGPAGGCAQVAGRAPGGNYRWRPVEAGQASAEPQRARTRARRRAADQRRRRWTQRALTGTSGPAATSRHARPGQAAGPARRSVGRRADLEAAGRPGSRPGGVRWWSGCVGRSVPDAGDGARAPSPKACLCSCRLVERRRREKLTCARVWVGAL